MQNPAELTKLTLKSNVCLSIASNSSLSFEAQLIFFFIPKIQVLRIGSDLMLANKIWLVTFLPFIYD